MLIIKREGDKETKGEAYITRCPRCSKIVVGQWMGDESHWRCKCGEWLLKERGNETQEEPVRV